MARLVWQQNLQKLIREKSRELLFLNSVEMGAGERTYILTLWTKSNAAKNYQASPYLILMDRSLLQMVFWLVLAMASAGVTAKSSKTHQRKIRELLILNSVENGGPPSGRISNSHGPCTVADGVLVGVGCGLGWRAPGLCLSPGTAEVFRPLLSLPGLELSQLPRGDLLWWTR
jgi:hypothetical protein